MDTILWVGGGAVVGKSVAEERRGAVARGFEEGFHLGLCRVHVERRGVGWSRGGDFLIRLDAVSGIVAGQ